LLEKLLRAKISVSMQTLICYIIWEDTKLFRLY